MTKTFKLVMVGDDLNAPVLDPKYGDLKNELLIRSTRAKFPDDYRPAIFDSYKIKLIYQEKSIDLALWSTTGQNEYDQLRPLSYANANVFLILYRDDSEISFENVKSKWIEEVKRFCPTASIVLVAIKGDKPQQVTFTEAQKLAATCSLNRCLACDLNDQEQVRKVFTMAVDSVINPTILKKNIINTTKDNILTFLGISNKKSFKSPPVFFSDILVSSFRKHNQEIYELAKAQKDSDTGFSRLPFDLILHIAKYVISDTQDDSDKQKIQLWALLLLKNIRENAQFKYDKALKNNQDKEHKSKQLSLWTNVVEIGKKEITVYEDSFLPKNARMKK